MAKTRAQERTLQEAVAEACLWLPEATEKISHGMPSYAAGGKQFASLCINHHGDGRVALWLAAPAGAQQLYAEREPEHYYVPAYVGPKGWLGVNLQSGLPWARICEHVREGFETVAPKRLRQGLGATPKMAAPSRPLTAEEIDPLTSTESQAALHRLAAACLALPESVAASQFGSPCWKAGKKTFASAYMRQSRLAYAFWVGGERQSMLADDPRYRVPAYTGPNGWTEINAAALGDEELAHLVLESYRHFALKRMLKALEAGPDG